MRNNRGSDVLFPDGYDGVLAALTPNLDIHLSQVVESIEWNGSGVEVATKSDTWSGDFCVVTLPIGVLKSRSVRFGPNLPTELTEAIDRIGAGLVNKVALRFERAFWDDAQFIFSAEDSTRFPLFFNQNIFQPKGNVLVNYGLGNFAEIVDNHPIAELEAELMKRLKKIYGTSAMDPVGSVASSWRRDPYAQCSYSFATPSTRVEHFKRFEAVLGGRVAFAGEHTSAEYRATVHGAFLSGVRAIDALVESAQ